MSILLVGCGNMGDALRKGWQRTKLNVTVIDPRAGDYATLDTLPLNYAPDTIVFAVKPQMLAEVLPAYAARFGQAPLYLSVAAGKPLVFYAKALGSNARIIRAMPNMPALISQGMTVLVAGTKATAADRATTAQLFDAVGRTAWLEDEALMHAATALSGSGPAYVFLFAEALAKAGVQAGLPEALAHTLAVETLAGAASLARDGGADLAQLRNQVASPGGTTEAALGVLVRGDVLDGLIQQAVEAAITRSTQLA